MILKLLGSIEVVLTNLKDFKATIPLLWYFHLIDFLAINSNRYIVSVADIQQPVTNGSAMASVLVISVWFVSRSR